MPRISYNVSSPIGPVYGGNFDPANAIERHGRTRGDRDRILYQTPTKWILYTGPHVGIYKELTELEAHRWLKRNDYDPNRVLFAERAKAGKMAISLGIQLKTELLNMAADNETTPNKLIKRILRKHIDTNE